MKPKITTEGRESVSKEVQSSDSAPSGQPGRLDDKATSASPATFIAQISDTHVVDPENPEPLFVPNNERFKDAVTRIEKETPRLHAVLATGDLTNGGQLPQYAAVTEMLEHLTIPFLPIPGNHDDRDGLRVTFPDMPWADAAHASWVMTVNEHVRIIGLDSTDPGVHGAAFDDEREAWLSDVLANTQQDGVQTILAMHHPPFSSEIQWMDRSGFEGRDRLTGVLQDSGISRIFCGHLHRPMQSVVAGVPAQVGLSTIWQVALDLGDNPEVQLIDGPCGYQIHRFSGSESVSHVRYIATEAEPFRPDWADKYN